MSFFKREIPSYELAPIETAQEASTWFFNKIISEKPNAPLEVPKNVNFIKMVLKISPLGFFIHSRI